MILVPDPLMVKGVSVFLVDHLCPVKCQRWFSGEPEEETDHPEEIMRKLPLAFYLNEELFLLG